jgi:CheY-like chemotaxis protein/anti-sigma regulatory factor (Ser/Thr protein kinase)
MMKKILVADDDRATRHMLKSVLGKAGFEVSVAVDGNAALKKLLTGEFDLLLTDVWMPGMNGLELLARQREEPNHVRTIVMTSDETSEVMLRAIREQAYHYIRKPVDPGAVVELVKDALSAKPSSSPIEVVSAVPHWIELLVPCELEAVARIVGFMAQVKSELSDEDREHVGFAFRELLTNAIEWGGKLDPNQKVRISYLKTKRMVQYRIADPGMGFRIEELSHAAVSNPEDDPMLHSEVRKQKGMRPGGYGLFMVRDLVDELLYNEVHNEVVLVKYLATASSAAGG